MRLNDTVIIVIWNAVSTRTESLWRVNDIVMHKNEISMHEDENFAQHIFMREIYMHEVVYSPTTRDNFWGKKIMPGAKVSFSCMEISFSCMKI